MNFLPIFLPDLLKSIEHAASLLTRQDMKHKNTNTNEHIMTLQKPASPYFKPTVTPTAHPPPTPDRTFPVPPYLQHPILTDDVAPGIDPRLRQHHRINPSAPDINANMVNLAGLDKRELIAAALSPSTVQLKQPPKAFTPYAPSPRHEVESETPSSRKRAKAARGKRRINDLSDFSDSDVSDSNRHASPRQKRQKRRSNVAGLVDYHDNSYSDETTTEAPRGSSKAKHLNTSNLPPNSTNSYQSRSNPTTTAMPSQKTPKSTKVASFSSITRKKAMGTRVPLSLATASEADKTMFRLKAEGKPWKEIQPVWEKMVGKKTGKSTLSVRYCKMKENFEANGGEDVSHCAPLCNVI